MFFHYKNCIILYDTGDFVDDYYVDPILRNDRSFLFCIECSEEILHCLRLIPVLIRNFQVNRVVGKNAKSTIEYMVMLSEEMNTKLKIKNDELIYNF